MMLMPEANLRALPAAAFEKFHGAGPEQICKSLGGHLPRFVMKCHTFGGLEVVSTAGSRDLIIPFGCSWRLRELSAGHDHVLSSEILKTCQTHNIDGYLLFEFESQMEPVKVRKDGRCMDHRDYDRVFTPTTFFTFAAANNDITFNLRVESVFKTLYSSVIRVEGLRNFSPATGFPEKRVNHNSASSLCCYLLQHAWLNDYYRIWFPLMKLHGNPSRVVFYFELVQPGNTNVSPQTIFAEVTVAVAMEKPSYGPDQDEKMPFGKIEGVRLESIPQCN